jgi:hypothetical protein
LPIGRAQTWAGHAIKRHGVVVYIACEGQGPDGMHKRIAAYKHRHGDDELPDLYLIEARPNLGWAGSSDVAELVTAIQEALPGEREVTLVLVDTLSRTLAGKDENTEGARNFLDNGEDISERLDCLVLAVHHEGAGDTDRPRGGTTLPAGFVATWHIKRQTNGGGRHCTLTVQEAKDSASDFAFDVSLGIHQFGDEHDEARASTLIVEAIKPVATGGGDEAPRQQRKKIAPNLRAFMTAFDQAMHRHGIEAHLPNNGPRVKAVSIELLRRTYYAKRADLDEDSKRKAFQRQSAKAVEDELLVSGEIGGTPMVWLPIKR